MACLVLALWPLTGSEAQESASKITTPSASDRPVVVFVPGITGSKLRHPTTGEVIWGDGEQLIRPRDGGYAVARPITRPLDDPEALEAYALIESISLAGYKRVIYGPFIDLLRERGGRFMDPESPKPTDDVLLFGYDWRQDNVVTAGRLHRTLERLRAARGVDRLPVILVGQSNGAHIGRYLVKYGAAPLVDAERGEALPPTNLRVLDLVLIGSSNGGSLRILTELDRGRTYIPMVGRKMQPETLFTFPSLYQDLPVYGDRYFLDPQGRQLDIDLYDPQTWKTLGWSVFASDATERVTERPDIFGNEAQRLIFLERSLDRAQRFHTTLRRNAKGFDTVGDGGPPRITSIQSLKKDSPLLAIVEGSGSDHRLRLLDDSGLPRDPNIRRRLLEKGDGHAPRTSQLWLSPQELEALVDGEPTYVDEVHRAMVASPETVEILRTVLERAGWLEP